MKRKYMITNLFFKLREMVESSPAKRDRLIQISLAACAVLNLAAWIAVPLFFWQFKEYIILQYNIYFGISSLGPWGMLFLFPLATLLASIVNFALAFLFFLQNKLMSHYLAVAAVALNLISLFALILIIYINI